VSVDRSFCPLESSRSVCSIGRAGLPRDGLYSIRTHERSLMRKLFALLLLATGVASAAIPAYMTIAGIPGSVIVAGREGTVEVLEFNQTIEVPLDATNLTPTGKTRHGLVTFHKAFDKSSTLLIARALSKAIIPSITISWYEITDQGTEQEYMRQTYTNVRIVKVRPYMHNVKDQTKERSVHQEEITFSYRVMAQTFLDGNLTTGATSSVAW
jgi:type VI secretion system secreted protein Hcp